MDITLYVRGQATHRDQELLAELRKDLAKDSWPASGGRRRSRRLTSMSEAAASFAQKDGFIHRGLWSYLPWIFKHEAEFGATGADRQRWVIFLESHTKVDLKALEAVLASYNASQSHYIGRQLVDAEHSIIHHYNVDVKYPHLHAGFALSGGLLAKIAARLLEKPLGGNQQIEPVWELAKYILDLHTTIEDRSDVFCAERRDGCATWILQREEIDRHRRLQSLSPSEVVITVKTVGKFHAERLPILQATWAARSTVKVLFLSNEEWDKSERPSDLRKAKVVDLSLEFGDLVDPAKESTEQGTGHCSKMMSILQHLGRHLVRRRWYVVVDDDTLVNVPRLLAVLSSHNDTEAVYMGDRYSWAHTEHRSGTNYVTTGGGMALSHAALQLVLGCFAVKQCICYKPNMPDDMTLGTWFDGTLGVSPTHEEGFRQSEPFNYNPEVLKYGDAPITFHRFGRRYLPAGASVQGKISHSEGNWKSWMRDFFRPAGGVVGKQEL